ncbi:LmeA family phospholipid-binding protein [Glaciibacter sp. 2TAF33]|uniref:LmeA family phospholipid-binding protein n=1 Tax=Glaciibacter sp. 2TAF33 TaxID=3233015 RepID=UPI003F8F64BE
MALTRRGIGGLVVASLLLLGLVGAYFIVDSVLRNYAQNRVRQEIANNLPEGVTGDVTVSISGFSVIAQYLGGSFDQVELKAPALAAGGAQASVHLVATDVPVDTAKTVGDVRGAIEMGQQSLDALLANADIPGNPTVKLGDGTVSYTGTITVARVPIGYTATAIPQAAGDSVLLTPTKATVTTAIGSLNLGGLVQRILGEEPLPICVAQYLPAGVDLTGVDVTPQRARITLHAPALRLTEEGLTTLGSCN